MISQLLLGFFLAVIVSAAAYLARALSPGGALAAAILGTVIFGLGGLAWAVLLLAFFVTSSGLSRLFDRRKSRLAEKFSKGSRRDAAQVLANGGIAGGFVLLHLLFPAAAWPWLGCAGALAAANADTWATELGVLSPTEPVLVTSGRPVERGTSGGVSLTGTAAALAGGLLLGLLAALLWRWGAPGGAVLPFGAAAFVTLWVALAGLAGSLVDSLLGATLQAIYTCPACQKETERYPVHTCGTPTIYKRGLPWLDNDWVNVTCTFVGGILAVIMVMVL